MFSRSLVPSYMLQGTNALQPTPSPAERTLRPPAPTPSEPAPVAEPAPTVVQQVDAPLSDPLLSFGPVGDFILADEEGDDTVLETLPGQEDELVDGKLDDMLLDDKLDDELDMGMDIDHPDPQQPDLGDMADEEDAQEELEEDLQVSQQLLSNKGLSQSQGPPELPKFDLAPRGLKRLSLPTTLATPSFIPRFTPSQPLPSTSLATPTPPVAPTPAPTPVEASVVDAEPTVEAATEPAAPEVAPPIETAPDPEAVKKSGFKPLSLSSSLPHPARPLAPSHRRATSLTVTDLATIQEASASASESERSSSSTLISQINELKSRNASLSSQLTALQQGQSSERVEIKKKISHLSEQLHDVKREKKGYSNVNARLRTELDSRREKEKWDLAIMDSEERETYRDQLDLEYRLDLSEFALAKERAHRIELQESLAMSNRLLSTLSTSRKVLLREDNSTQQTIARLRSELQASREELDLADETASETVVALQNELAALKEGMDGNVGDSKELKKEKEKREKAEKEVKDLKAQLKTLNSSLKEAESRAHRFEKSATSAQTKLDEAKARSKAKKQAQNVSESSPAKALPPVESVKTLASRERKKNTIDGSDPIEELVQETQMDDDYAPPSPPPAPKEKVAAKKRKVDVYREEADDEAPKKAPAAKKKAAPAMGEKGTNNDKKEVAPPKKKMRKLFNGSKPFDWQTNIENADVNNGLGLPTSLSPIKTAGSAPSLGGLFGAKGKKSIFG